MPIFALEDFKSILIPPLLQYGTGPRDAPLYRAGHESGDHQKRKNNESNVHNVRWSA
jgi:hypothetical protein